MPCYNPTRVVMDGDHRIQWSSDWRVARLIDGQTVVNMPCRKCIGCNMATQREWSVRCFHEAQCHTTKWRDTDLRLTTTVPNNCVVTLTYADSHLPESGLLKHDDFQRFFKRLRKLKADQADKLKIPLSARTPLSYFMAGEYGGKTHRPHFHTIIFGYNPEDLYPIRMGSQNLQCSNELDDLWSQSPTSDPEAPSERIGVATVDTFTFAGAAYVAGYVAKKMVPGDSHLGPTTWIKDENGNSRLVPVAPEYRHMSTRPAIGYRWISKWQNLQEVYSADEIKIGDWSFHPPKYYDSVLQTLRPDLVSDIILNRRAGMAAHAEVWTKDRCSSAEQICLDNLQRRRDSL